MAVNLFLCFCGLTLLHGCRGDAADSPPEKPAGTCSLEMPANADEAELIHALLAAEGRLVVDQEIAPLMQLWAEDSFVADGKHTPDDESDDQIWLDKDAIRHRYVRTVFPGAPSAVTPGDLDIHMEGERAEVRATTRIGSEIAPSGDLWEVVYIDGCWLIHSLTYNLEPLP